MARARWSRGSSGEIAAQGERCLKLVEGYGYDITGRDVWAAHDVKMKAAQAFGRRDETLAVVRALVAGETFGERFVTRILGRELRLPGPLSKRA